MIVAQALKIVKGFLPNPGSDYPNPGQKFKKNSGDGLKLPGIL